MVTAAKAASQVTLHMGVAFAVMYAVTGSLAFGGVAAVLEPVCNVILLPLHERVWQHMLAKRRSQAGVGQQSLPSAQHVPGIS